MISLNEIKGNFVGLFDSGFGGISVLNSAIKLIPNENFVYFADSENFPYGKKSKDDLTAIGQNIISKFYKYSPKCLIIACGTMSTSNPKKLREPFKDLNIIGTYPNFWQIFKPGLVLENHHFSYSDKNGINASRDILKILILSTTATSNSVFLKEKIKLYDSLALIYNEPADGIVKAVENDMIDSPELKDYLSNLLKPYVNFDYIVLGCTHFPFAKNVIKKIVSTNTNIISGCEVSAKECYEYMKSNNLLNEELSSSTFSTQKTPIIQVIDAKSTEKRKETFMRLLDTNGQKYDISFGDCI
ncbi:MAG: aspartate/glutamate racemase family protein [Lachnospiraceae bacterium]|nr:aspartate/glutamate racemase family protein [Lachnospiraceae bacterium]